MSYSVFFYTWASIRLLPFSILSITNVQHLMRKRFIKIHASDSSALLLGPRSALQSSSFLPSVSHAGEFHLSRFTHLILRLRYLDLGLLCRSHPSCLQYLMRGRVSPIKVYASDSTAMLFGPRTTLQTSVGVEWSCRG